MADPQLDAIEVLILASNVDARQRGELEKRLLPLQRLGKLKIWHHGKILPGSHRETEWTTALGRSRLILPLLTIDFVADSELLGQLDGAIARHRAGEARLIPVLLRPALLDGLGIDDLQTLPASKKWVSDFSRQEDGLQEVAEGIQRALEPVPEVRGATEPGDAKPALPQGDLRPPASVAKRTPHPSTVHVEVNPAITVNPTIQIVPPPAHIEPKVAQNPLLEKLSWIAGIAALLIAVGGILWPESKDGPGSPPPVSSPAIESSLSVYVRDRSTRNPLADVEVQIAELNLRRLSNDLGVVTFDALKVEKERSLLVTFRREGFEPYDLYLAVQATQHVVQLEPLPVFAPSPSRAH